MKHGTRFGALLGQPDRSSPESGAAKPCLDVDASGGQRRQRQRQCRYQSAHRRFLSRDESCDGELSRPVVSGVRGTRKLGCLVG